MTAPRLDLKYIRRVVQTGRELGWNASSIAIDEIEALLSIAEAAEEYRSAEIDWCQAGDRESVDYMAAFNRVGDACKALDAALAAVRKEEKGE
jgi:hypothetical protein